jgi:hypothetical protein
LRFRFAVGSLGFFIDLILPTELWRVNDSACNRNESQEHLLGGKDGRCLGMTTLPPSCADRLKVLGVSNSWSSKGLSIPVIG